MKRRNFLASLLGRLTLQESPPSATAEAVEAATTPLPPPPPHTQAEKAEERLPQNCKIFFQLQLPHLSICNCLLIRPFNQRIKSPAWSASSDDWTDQLTKKAYVAYWLPRTCGEMFFNVELHSHRKTATSQLLKSSSKIIKTISYQIVRLPVRPLTRAEENVRSFNWRLRKYERH